MKMQMRIVLLGSYEAVSEAGVCVRRASGVENLTSSGIEPVPGSDAPGLHQMVLDCGNIAGGAGPFCEALSKQHLTTLVGLSIAAVGTMDEQPDHMDWGAGVCLAGTEVVGGISGGLPSSLPVDVRALVDDSVRAGSLPVSALPRLHEYAGARFLSEARARLDRTLKEGAGPQWSHITHVANDSGLRGIATCLAADGVGGESAGKRLVADAALSFRNNSATWVDGLFFGSRLARAGSAPLSDVDVVDWPRRRIELLEVLGAADSPLRQALLLALSSPLVCLRDATHPLPLLVRDMPADERCRAGLHALIDATRQHGQEFAEYMQDAVTSVPKSNFSAESVRLALAFGSSPGYIASRCLPNSTAHPSHQGMVASKLIDAFAGIYGTLAAFPEELRRAFTSRGDTVEKALEARLTEESMRTVISSWPASKRAGAGVAVSVKRRRVL